ncbi:MAG: M67 family metallopeptidase [Caldilineaceae bacterium]
MTTVQLPQHIYDTIIAHAREGKPEEICGVLRGRGLVAYEAFRGQNIANDRINNYEVDVQTLLLQFEFEKTDDEMMGIYHSHPISVAYPSATDAWNAHYPDSVYFICSLEYDEAPVLRAFRMIPHFLELNLAVLKPALDFYETRPNLFAYYQSKDTAIPAVLVPVAQQAATPFYVVYYAEGEEQEVRVVALEECTIQVTVD